MKIKKTAQAVLAVVCTSAMILTGCASQQGTGANGADGSGSSQSQEMDRADIPAGDYNETPYEEVKDGGEIISAIDEVSPQQNVWHADAPTYTRKLWQWYNPVVSLFTAEGDFSPNPDYVTDVKEEMVDGNTVVTYTINEDAHYNDGTPIDWTSFETVWKINNGENDGFSPAATDGYDRITSVTPGDSDKQAVVTFNGAYPWWVSLFNFFAHPALQDPANYDAYVNELHPEWGAGPYTVASADFNKGEVIFERNSDWWGDKGKLDRRIFRQMNPDASINAFKNGEIDFTGAGARNRYEKVNGMDGIELKFGHRPFISLLTLNSKSPGLDELEVRQALAGAIDRSTLAKIWFQGLPVSEDPPGSFMFMTFQPQYKDLYSEVVQYDPDKSNQILEDAGWKMNADGIREKDDKKLDFRYMLVGSDEITRNTAAATQRMLKDVGINIEIVELPGNKWSEVSTTRDFDILPMGITAGDAYAVAFFDQYYGSDSQLNLSSTSDAEGDAKIKELQELPTREEQSERSNELEKEFLARHGLIPEFGGPEIRAQKEGMANVGAYGYAVVRPQDIGWKK